MLLYSARSRGRPQAVQAYDQEHYCEGAEEGQKCVVVVNADTVIDPRTVMVKSLDTFVADCAMPGARSTKDFTIWAHFTWVYVLEKVNELVIFPYDAWVFV